MKLLDRYIARQYLINVVALLLIFASFVVTIDVSLNFDRFVSAADRYLAAEPDPGFVRRAVVTTILIADLWWPRLLQLFNYTLGLVMVGAMGFTFAQLVRGRELVGVLAGGIALHRAAMPIFVASLALTGVQVANQELVIPRIAAMLVRDHGDAGKRALGETSVPMYKDARGRLWFARAFRADEGVLTGLMIWERDEQGLAHTRVSADSARWTPRGWELENGRAVRLDGPDAPVAVGRIETNLDPTAIKMRRFAGFAQSLSWAQVSQMLSRPELVDERGAIELERIRWGRLSILTANLLALAVAVPFFLRREPCNMIVQSLKCAPIAITALMGGVLGASAAIPGLPPQIGVFVPVMVLLPVAIGMVTSIRT
ncbi:MAG: LptF/LptG family permease [Phycisphaerae bacterium]|nr:LptF/LptG family permease [Phycisphaerae bacterium]